MDDIKLIKVLGQEETVFSIQKCHISSSILKEIAPSYQVGNYVIIQMSSDCKCVCKLLLKNDLHKNFCLMDPSVVTFDNKQTFYGLPCKLLKWDYDCILSRQIQVIPSIMNIKALSLSVVFENVICVKKWKENRSKLLQILKNILRLYIVVDSSVVYLRNLQPCQRMGVNCLVIHSIMGQRIGDLPEIGRITSVTKISIENLLSRIKFEQYQNASNIPALGGLLGPYQTLKEVITCGIQYKPAADIKLCRQVLLVGPPGCGKTSLVHKVVADCGAVLVTVLGPEVCSPRPGDTETTLRQLFQDAANLANEGMCVILLDEVDSLCPERDSRGAKSHVTRITTQLLTLLEQASQVKGLVIIATTNRPFALDSALRRPGRLETEIYIGVPTEHERREILNVSIAPLLRHLPLNTTELCSHVARLTPGYVGADLSLLCQDVAFNRHKIKDPICKTELVDFLEDFRRACAKIRPSSLRSGLGVVTTQPVSFSEIGGLDDIKQTLRASVEWPLLHPEAFARLNLPQPRGVLLYGPPGCAKTTIARALASSNNTTFLSVSAAELYSPFVGDAERSVEELFHRARLGAPTILFIDEIDALVGSRGEKRTGVQERVLSAFLTEMDGIGIRLEKMCTTSSNTLQKSEKQFSNSGVIVIGATNRPDMLDDAILRPGRFDKLLYVPPPDAKNRLNILQLILSKTPLSPCVNLEAIATCTEFCSGADLTSLCREAVLCALTEQGMAASSVQHKHFLRALQGLQPSLRQSQLDWYNSYRNTRIS